MNVTHNDILLQMHMVATGGHRIDDRTVFFSAKNGAKKDSSTAAVVSAGVNIYMLIQSLVYTSVWLLVCSQILSR